MFSRSPAAAAATLPLIVMVALAPAFTRPLMQVTVWPAMLQLKRLVALTVTGVMADGMVSVTLTPSALPVPRLLTVRV